MVESVHTLAANVIEASLIEAEEGFLAEARWDVNHYRLGYGSDTEGPDQTNVTQHMVTTRERAFQNLEGRIPQYEATAIHQVGSAAWNALPDAAKAGLLDMVYNYGSLPSGVVSAVAHQSSLAIIAAAVEARAGDNHGINKARRAKEARIIRGEEKIVADASVAAKLAPPAAPAPAPAPAAPKASGIDVTQITGMQAALNLLVPENPLAVDGSFGPVSVAKMKAFQASTGSPQTGDTSFYSVLAVYEALKAKGVQLAA